LFHSSSTLAIAGHHLCLVARRLEH
jgi:hypothetical protein